MEVTAEEILQLLRVFRGYQALVAYLLDMPLDAMERMVIERALDRCKGNKHRTALELGITTKTVYNRLARYKRDDEHEAKRTKEAGNDARTTSEPGD